MSQNNNGISFFNPWQDETRGVIAHMNKDGKLFIQLIRYNEGQMNAISVELDHQQIQLLLQLIAKSESKPAPF
jgi:hypothetical protein